jgi:ubiquinone/menaquinone biosynthesis C-methylase UbiE
MRGIRIDPERAEVRVLRRWAPLRGARVLEIGCGDGRLTRRYASLTRSVQGIDPDPDEIERARRRLPGKLGGKVRFAVHRAEDLPYRRGTFDLVLLSWSL